MSDAQLDRLEQQRALLEILPPNLLVALEKLRCELATSQQNTHVGLPFKPLATKDVLRHNTFDGSNIKCCHSTSNLAASPSRGA